MLTKTLEWFKTLPILNLIIAGGVIFIVGGQVWLWYHPKEQASTTTVVLPEAKRAESVTKYIVQPPQHIYIYQKEELAGKINLPSEVKKDPTIQVTATADIKPAPYGGTAVSYMNMTTGKSAISFEAKGRPLFEWKKEVEASLDYGVSSKGTVMQGGVRFTPVRIGGFNIHLKGEATSSDRTEARGMIGTHMTWD
jgi:hypothetical protein